MNNNNAISQCEMLFNDEIKFVDDYFDIQYGKNMTAFI